MPLRGYRRADEGAIQNQTGLMVKSAAIAIPSSLSASALGANWTSIVRNQQDRQGLHIRTNRSG